MKVFISWSGRRSREMANALRDWLPMVLQYVEPFVSDKDISAGDRWAQAIAGELESSNFGIICVTPENINSEWILFESGALSKSMLDGKVIPLLFGLELSDLSGPLSQFQAQKVDESGMMEIVRSINLVAENKASDSIVEQLIPTLWPRLSDTVENISDSEPSERHRRPQYEILEELVTGVRGLNSRMRDIDPDASNKRDESRYRKRVGMSRLHPHLIEEFMMMSLAYEKNHLYLLVIAGFIREDLPWIAEVIVEAYREIKVGNAEDADNILRELRTSIKYLSHSKLMYEMSGGSKHLMRLAEELPMFLDMGFHQGLSENSSITTKSSI